MSAGQTSKAAAEISEDYSYIRRKIRRPRSSAGPLQSGQASRPSCIRKHARPFETAYPGPSAYPIGIGAFCGACLKWLWT